MMRGSYHIETSPLTCTTNQGTGFYMVGTSVMKEFMLMSGKSRNVFYTTLPKFWTYFQNIGLFLSERGYLNPQKQAFKKWDCVCAGVMWVNIFGQKCLFVWYNLI